MYLFLFLIPILLLLLFANHFRKKKKIQKVNCLSFEEKCTLLEDTIGPFGYKYLPASDLFSTRIDAPQREFGYATLYDKGAPHLNLIFDSLPVYFHYQGRTWLLEFWKGQYGINTGAEIGLYYTNRILEPTEIKNTFFKAAEDADMLQMSLELHRGDSCVAEISQKHWWLTAFRMGSFSKPSDLCLKASVTFPTPEMANAFMEGLIDAGYSPEEICRSSRTGGYGCMCYGNMGCSSAGCGNASCSNAGCSNAGYRNAGCTNVGCRNAGCSNAGCNTVSFTFDYSPRVYGIFRRMRIRLAQCSNRLWCKIFLFVTRPFELSMDRLLYLYFYLPFAFRKMLRAGKKQRNYWRKERFIYELLHPSHKKF